MSTTPRRFGCLGIFILILLVVSVVFNIFFLAGDVTALAFGESNGFREVVVQKSAPQVSTKIALIRLDGLIANAMPGRVGDSMVEDIKIQLKGALADKDVRAIVLSIDSPGGEVTASDILFNAVKKAKASKPIVVSMSSVAASGGYYVALGGSHIMAHDTTFTGSIGVIMQSINYTDLFGKVGLEMVTFKSGAFKDMLSGSRKHTPEEAAYIQGMITQTYDKFVGIVATERNLPLEPLKTGPADGRVISGKDAAAAKLIDEIGDIEAAYAKAMQLGGAPGSAVISYDAPPNLRRYLSLLGESDAPKKIQVNLSPSPALPIEPGRMYMLPSTFVP